MKRTPGTGIGDWVAGFVGLVVGYILISMVVEDSTGGAGQDGPRSRKFIYGSEVYLARYWVCLLRYVRHQKPKATGPAPRTIERVDRRSLEFPQKRRPDPERSQCYRCPYCPSYIDYATQEAGLEFRCPSCKLTSNAPSS